jgi:hypothetical protein
LRHVAGSVWPKGDPFVAILAEQEDRQTLRPKRCTTTSLLGHVDRHRAAAEAQHEAFTFGL